jgi:regulator of protease activity HflC (stomatin/prohibitin superfamily)
MSLASGTAVQLLLGLVLGLAFLPLFGLIFRAMTIEVHDEHAALVTHFGKLEQTFKKPGLHVYPSKVLPWVHVKHISLQKDFRHIEHVHVNDSRGTTLMVDLWLEFSITDPAKAIFGVSDWESSLRNLVSHAATSILGSREFSAILKDRSELSKILQAEVDAETERWGIDVAFVFIRNVSLLPDVSRQIFQSISARLARARAHIEERGRIDVAKLDAQTQVRVAELVAEAKGQYPLAIGSALGKLKQDRAVFDAYAALYNLSQVRPHRTVAFRGFAESELRAVDAAMLQEPSASIVPTKA